MSIIMLLSIVAIVVGITIFLTGLIPVDDDSAD